MDTPRLHLRTLVALAALGALAPWSARSETANPAAARDALAVGDCFTAVEQWPAPDEAAPRIAIARCFSVLGDHDGALALLDVDQLGDLAGYGSLVRAEALIGLSRPGDAAAELAGVHLSGDAGTLATFLRGKALLDAKDYEGARGVLSGMLSGSFSAAAFVPTAGGVDPAEVRYWLAESAAQRGTTDRAIPVWRSIWTRNPTSPWSDRAAQRLAQAGVPVPDAASPDGVDLIKARADTLDKHRDYKAALALRDLLPADDSEAGRRALAKACFRAKDYPRAVALFATLSSPTPSERFDHALGMSRTGDYDKAAELYRALIAAAPSSSEADTASYKLGYLKYDKGELEAGLKLFAEHLGRYPHTAHGEEARWFTAWSLFRLERYEEADAAMADLVSRYPSATLSDGARYWRARLAGMHGDTAAEKAGYEAVLSKHPTSGYAWFAAWRLGKSYPSQPVAAAPEAPASLDTEAFRRGKALALVGLSDWAREELSGLSGAARAGGKQGSLALAHTLIAAGDYTGAQALAGPYCTNAWSKGDPVAQQACWPRPLGAYVSGLASDGRLPSNLPFGIMTAESAMKPWVTSAAGARGLMQMMPELAGKWHDQLFPGQPYDPMLLYHPGYNASLGVTELADLRAAFDNSGVNPPLPLVIAGYNGGPEAVQRWLDGYPRPPEPDLFAENISYTETRQYVRRVLGYLQTYRYVYGD